MIKKSADMTSDQEVNSGEENPPEARATEDSATAPGGLPEPAHSGPLDLGELDLVAAADRGATLNLLHPVTGRSTGAKLKILGSDSEAYRRNLRTIRDKVASSPDAEPTDPDRQAITQLARLAAASVAGWDGVVFGQPLVFSLDQAIALFVARPWIIEQVAAFRDTRSNFFKP